MKPTFRALLADSHIAAVAIAVLLLWGLISIFEGLSNLVLLGSSWIIFGIPYHFPSVDLRQRMFLTHSLTSLTYAVVYLASAWLLAHRVYRMGPLPLLSAYRTRLNGLSNV